MKLLVAVLSCFCWLIAFVCGVSTIVFVLNHIAAPTWVYIMYASSVVALVCTVFLGAALKVLE